MSTGAFWRVQPVRACATVSSTPLQHRLSSFGRLTLAHVWFLFRMMCQRPVTIVDAKRKNTHHLYYNFLLFMLSCCACTLPNRPCLMSRRSSSNDKIIDGWKRLYGMRFLHLCLYALVLLQIAVAGMLSCLPLIWEELRKDVCWCSWKVKTKILQRRPYLVQLFHSNSRLYYENVLPTTMSTEF